jgi:hypothetical protein
METAQDLRVIVRDNLDTAEENGQFEPGEYLDGLDAEEIARDMAAFAEDVEDYEAAQLIPHIEEWLKEKGHGKQASH